MLTRSKTKKKNVRIIIKTKKMDLAHFPTSFPYKSISGAVAQSDYKKLCDRTFINNMSRIGNAATDKYTFKMRVATNIRGHSHLDYFADHKDKILRCMKSLKYKEITNAGILAGIRMRIGSVNQFRPAYAKFIYTKYGAQKVLDISAGWGGRMLGAMACGIDYTGFDTNKALVKPYQRIVAAYAHTGDCKLITADTATINFKKYDYDMVFTSPPYFMLEKYEDMPQYEDKDDFNARYWRPVVKGSWRGLKKGGHFILNCPDEMGWLAAQYIGAMPDETLPYYISSRTKDGKKRSEKVFVWHKHTK